VTVPTPHIQPTRSPAEITDEQPELRLLARIEGLVGEEIALLKIPAQERSQEQHDRLRSIGDELDRVWEALRERAARLGHRDTPPAPESR
jgi:hypothetical protein